MEHILHPPIAMHQLSTISSSAAFVLSLALMLSAGCSEEGTCLLGEEEKPWACIEMTSQVSASDAHMSCSMNGGTWQEASCSVEGAFGQCVDLFGSTTVFYPEYLTTFSLSGAEMRETCEEQQGVYTEF